MNNAEKSLGSIKRALFLTLTILTLISSDKIGNEIEFLGLELSGEGHNLFVLLVVLTAFYYASEYFWLAWRLFRIRAEETFSDDQSLQIQISDALSEIENLEARFENTPPQQLGFGGVSPPRPPLSVDQQLVEYYRIMEQRLQEASSKLESLQWKVDQNGENLTRALNQTSEMIRIAEAKLADLVKWRNIRFTIFELVSPFILFVFGILHGFGEFWPVIPTFLD